MVVLQTMDKEKIMSKPIVEVLRDENNEMVSIIIDGTPFTEGNFWDMSIDIWVDVLEKIGVNVIEGKYSYGE